MQRRELEIPPASTFDDVDELICVGPAPGGVLQSVKRLPGVLVRSWAMILLLGSSASPSDMLEKIVDRPAGGSGQSSKHVTLGRRSGRRAAKAHYRAGQLNGLSQDPGGQDVGTRDCWLSVSETRADPRRLYLAPRPLVRAPGLALPASSAWCCSIWRCFRPTATQVLPRWGLSSAFCRSPSP